jgi:hypothetical protein
VLLRYVVPLCLCARWPWPTDSLSAAERELVTPHLGRQTVAGLLDRLLHVLPPACACSIDAVMIAYSM